MFGQALTETKLNDLIVNSNIYKIFEPEKLDIETKYSIYSVVNNFVLLYSRTKEEIIEIFTLEEIALICDALNSTIYTERITIKQYVLSNVTSGIEFRGLDKNWNISDPDSFIGKLENITETQAMVLMIVTNEFWEIKGTYYKDKLNKILEI